MNTLQNTMGGRRKYASCGRGGMGGTVSRGRNGRRALGFARVPYDLSLSKGSRHIREQRIPY